MSNVAKLNLPEGTEYQKKNDLDPLGHAERQRDSVSDAVPGIGNVTLRMRYCGLYARLSWVYANRTSDTDPQRRQRMIRRTGALFALIAQQRGDEYAVTGTYWARETLDNLGPPTTLDFAADAERRARLLLQGAVGVAEYPTDCDDFFGRNFNACSRSPATYTGEN